jgi:hypothetical protein
MPGRSSGDNPKSRYIVAPSSASAPLIDPLTLSPRFWHDANGAYVNSGSPVNNDPVSSTTDRSGNSRTFTATGSNRPTWKTSQFGTAPGIQFAQASTQYQVAGAAVAVATGVTLWAVFKTSTNDATSANPNTNPPLTLMGDSTGNSALNMGLEGNELSVCYWSGAWAKHNSSGLSLANGSPHTIAVTITSGGSLKAYADGVEVKTATVSYYGAMTINIHGVGYAAGDGFDGVWAEGMCFGTALTAQNITDLHLRARSLWGAP